MTSTTTSTPATTLRPRKRNDIHAVLRQYLTQKQYSVLIPLYILALVWVISVIIVLLMGIKAGLPLPQKMQETNAAGNVGPVMSFPFFLVSAGALCVNRQFNASLAFGSTRRAFWIGTSLGFLITSATTALFGVVGLALEKMTSHWGLGLRAFDVAVLGSGNYLFTFLIIFTLSMTALLIGAIFGTIFRSFGPTVLSLSIIGTVILLLGMTAIFIWKSAAFITFFTPWGYWTLIAGLALISLIADVAGYIINQRAVI